ncbi:MAG: helix-turn-helix domain-containing protein [Oscillospiraceae bacterium]
MTKMAERLKELRMDHHRSQEDIAAMLYINRTTYCKYESGIHEPSVESLCILADFYGVDADYLIGRSSVRKKCGEFSEEEQKLIENCRKNGVPEILSADEKKLIENYRSASEAGRQTLSDFAGYISQKSAD